MTKQLLFVFLALLVATATFAQDKATDPVLFKVEDTPVLASEFEYIYSKTNGDKADSSKASLQEYLDLYTKFKLKVHKAREMQLDTIPALKRELDGYRKQLADSYLMDREVTEKLIQEVYNRKKQDVDISHILVMLKPDAPLSVRVKAESKMKNIQKKLAEGAAFEDIAKTLSDDKASKNKGGRVGYLTAALPNGFYELENALYELPLNTISDVVQTSAGLHLVKVHARRPARGEMEVGHILVRVGKAPDAEKRAKTTIDELYQQLEAGEDFEAIAKANSEDKSSANRGGYLGFFGINKYEKNFENAAFNLKKDSTYTKPIKTRVGWHIIRRISKRELQPYNVVKGRLEQEIRQDERFDLAKRSMIENIKENANFTETRSSFDAFKETLNDDFLTFKWKAPDTGMRDVLFAFSKDFKVTLADLAQYMEAEARDRIRMGRSKQGAKQVADILYDKFVDAKALEFEEGQLEEKYPDFKALMREYEEGILLFEATKLLVWDKASQDTTGLRNFFQTVEEKYQWGERARVNQYGLKDEESYKLDAIRVYATTHSMEETLEQFNKKGKEILIAKERLLEHKRNEQLDAIDWKVNALTASVKDKRAGRTTFMKIEEIVPPGQKTLQEARGYVVADYQDFLEKEWVKELRREYDVKVNKRVFNSIVKKYSTQ
ncbi:MAG: peptidylprolyl isomerase [Bacteroidota bacterium]